MLSNSTTDGKAPALRMQERALLERGILMTTLREVLAEQPAGDTHEAA